MTGDAAAEAGFATINPATSEELMSKEKRIRELRLDKDMIKFLS